MKNENFKRIEKMFFYNLIKNQNSSIMATSIMALALDIIEYGQKESPLARRA